MKTKATALTCSVSCCWRLISCSISITLAAFTPSCWRHNWAKASYSASYVLQFERPTTRKPIALSPSGSSNEVGRIGIRRAVREGKVLPPVSKTHEGRFGSSGYMTIVLPYFTESLMIATKGSFGASLLSKLKGTWPVPEIPLAERRDQDLKNNLFQLLQLVNRC